VKDPGLGKGWAYFVEEMRYKAHLATYGEQPTDVSGSLRLVSNSLD
jgi:hypothetical protein